MSNLDAERLGGRIITFVLSAQFGEEFCDALRQAAPE